MYESASRVGVFPGSSSSQLPAELRPHMDDSYAQLGIKSSSNGTVNTDASAQPENSAQKSVTFADSTIK